MRFAVILFISSMTLAQAPRTPTIYLGDTFAQVRSKFGAPRERLGPSYRYYRKTTRNEFRIDVWWQLDDTVSQLHPTLRVSEISINPDRRQSWAEIAKQIPEAKLLCTLTGCDSVKILAGQFGHVDQNDSNLLFCRSKPATDGQRWFIRRDAPEPCMLVSFEGPEPTKPVDPDDPTPILKIGDVDFGKFIVKSVEIYEMTPSSVGQTSSYVLDEVDGGVAHF